MNRQAPKQRNKIQPGTIVILLVVGGTLLSATIMGAILATRRARLHEDASPAVDQVLREELSRMTIPEFQLTDQLGRVTDRSVFQGQWTVLEFMFSACTLACPTMKGNLYAAQQEMGDLPVQFVSISVDPEHDTPAWLKQYSSRWGVAPDKWRFLSGDFDTVLSICEGGLGFGIRRDPDQTITRPDGSSMDNIMHPTRFFVISPEVRVVGMYDGLDRQDALRMAHDLRRFIRTGSY